MSSPVSEPQVGGSALIAIVWVGVGISGAFLVARLGIRFKISRNWALDDAFVLASWIFALANTCLWTVIYKDAYFMIAFVRLLTNRIPTEAAIFRFLRGQYAAYVLSYCSLWCIKLSFLFFFRSLGERIWLQRLIWWITMVLVVFSFGAALGTLETQCLLSDPEELISTVEPIFALFTLGPPAFLTDVVANCTGSRAKSWIRIGLSTTTALDIVTDVAIIIVSTNVLWRAKINLPKKLGLIGIFSLTAFIIIVSIIRLKMGLSGDKIDLSWIVVWNGVETCVAIIVACLASFRRLYIMYKAKSNRPPTHTLSSSAMDPILLKRSKGRENASIDDSSA